MVYGVTCVSTCCQHEKNGFATIRLAEWLRVLLHYRNWAGQFTATGRVSLPELGADFTGTPSPYSVLEYR
jgi:hypothetical protein